MKTSQNFIYTFTGRTFAHHQSNCDFCNNEIQNLRLAKQTVAESIEWLVNKIKAQYCGNKILPAVHHKEMATSRFYLLLTNGLQG